MCKDENYDNLFYGNQFIFLFHLALLLCHGVMINGINWIQELGPWELNEVQQDDYKV